MNDEELRSAFMSGAASVGDEFGLQPAGAPPVDFCEIWPKARGVLKAIASVIIFIPIPGGGAGAGAVLNGLISVGDELNRRLCGA